MVEVQISAEHRRRLDGHQVLASLSGGKDSTALALWLRELDIPHARVFADTGFEASETYAYLEHLRERLGPIVTVRNESLWQDALPGEEGMLTLVRRKRMFPSRLMRFCTQQLKLHPIRDFIRDLTDTGDPVVNAIGVRAAESAARARMPEWEFWDEMDADIWRPLLTWSEQDVIDMHRRHGVRPNPLYLSGARRVGCLPCIHARKHDIRHIPTAQLVRIRRVEDELTADAIDRGCARPTRAFFQVRGPEGLRFTPIDEVVRLAHLHRGRPIEAGPEPTGCVRWGLCESSPGEAPAELNVSELPRPRIIGDGHLRSFGFSAEVIATWLQAGLLQQTPDSGFYARTPAFDHDFERMKARRTVGRGHLIEAGVPARQVAAWLRRGILARTQDSGFYTITQAMWESLARPSADRAAGDESPALDSPLREDLPRSRPPDSAAKLRIAPCTISEAKHFVTEHHRHHKAPVSGLFAVGVTRGGERVGAAIVGRPVARGLQDGGTVEVTRVCTRGDPNACSMLLSACRRIALALGYRRVITYTLEAEPGTSLRAAGWRETARVRGRSWHCTSRPRHGGTTVDKRRWEAPGETESKRGMCLAASEPGSASPGRSGP